MAECPHLLYLAIYYTVCAC